MDEDESHISGLPNKREKDENCPFMSGLSSLGSETFNFDVFKVDLLEISCYDLAPPSVACDNVHLKACSHLRVTQWFLIIILLMKCEACTYKYG